jgi:photosystem II stability/assembly factor-like uncharacterized protein
LLLAAALPLYGGQDFWTGNGPEGGPVYRLLFDPSDGATAYSLMIGRLDRSRDGGIHWSPIGRDLPEIIDIAIDPANPSNLYAIAFLDRVFRSTDQGTTWVEQVSLPALIGMSILAFDPSGSGTVFASIGTNLFRGALPITTWSPSDTGLSGLIFDVAVAPGTPSVLYTATTTGVFRSSDGGSTWMGTTALPLNGYSPTSVKIRPGTTGTVFVGLSDGRVFRSIDGGVTWALSVTASTTAALAICPSSPGTVYAAFRDGVYVTSDGGDNWTLKPIAISPFLPLYVAVAAPNTCSVLLAGNGRGIYRTSDSADSWVASNSGLRHTTIASVGVAPSASDVMLATDSNSGTVFRTTNGGDDWSEVVPDRFGTSVAFASSSPSTVYVGGSGGVMRSTDSGAHFSQFPTYVPDVFDLKVDPGDPNVAYAATSAGVYTTVNGGVSWDPRSPGLNEQVGRIAITPGQSQVVYASRAAGGLYMSANAGGNWAPIPYPGGMISDVIVLPGSSPAVLAVSYTGVYRSIDQGATWATVGNGLPPNDTWILAVDPSNATILYAGTGSSVWKSTDRGDHFVSFASGLPRTWIRALALSTDGRRLLAGSYDSGAFTYTITSNSFYTVAPYGGPALAANMPRTFNLAGQCGIPATARAVAANVAVTLPLADGFLAAWQGQTVDPGTSTLNFKAGRTRSSNATLVLGPAGDALFNLNMPSGSGHVIVDVTGYYAP